MKRNLLPLLGIAFVVALAASGIFYGVFISQLRQVSSQRALRRIAVAARSLESGTVLSASDLKMTAWAGELPPGAFESIEAVKGKSIYSPVVENEPLTGAALSFEKAAAGLGLRKGMRALSIHVYDSSGVLPFLSAGQRVDLQVVQNRSRPDAILKTILQNVEILAVSKPETNQFATSPAIVTLLVTPENADRVALADSAGAVRLLLRNAVDNEERMRPVLAFASLFGETHIETHQTSRRMAAAAQGPPEQIVDFLVQVVGATSATVEQIHGIAAPGSAAVSVLITSLPDGDSGERLRKSIQQQSELLSTSHVRGSSLRPVYLETGKRWQSAQGNVCGLSIRLKPCANSSRGLRLRLQPELTVPTGTAGVVTRRAVADLDLEYGQSAIVTGLAEPGAAPALIEQLFSGVGQQGANRELIVMITPNMLRPERTVAAAR